MTILAWLTQIKGSNIIMKLNIFNFHFIITFVKWMVIFFFTSTILAVILFKYIPVLVTPLMVSRTCSQIADGHWPTFHHSWVSIRNMSPDMPLAVMASEDQRFLQHHGFDFNAIQKAVKHNQHSSRKHGASTISQQTAKNVFLWESRTWLRKGLEMYFTVLIEFVWGKERIMEVYLNSIETGNGLYGVNAVAEYNLGKPDTGEEPASQLTRSDCALIAATLPNPRRFSSKEPSAYMLKRQRQILTQMRYVKWPYEYNNK